MDSKVAPISTADLQALIGKEIGVSDWMLVDQKRIDTFADAVDDHQFIHVDPERAAKEAPFGGTIAHGFLTLSMIAQMGYQVIAPLENLSMVINYGLDKVRFISAVKVGSRVRGRFVLLAANARGAGRWVIRYGVTVEIENETKAACTCESISLQVVEVPKA